MVAITREKVKTYLGITSAGSDNLIDIYIPVVDSQIREIAGKDYESLVVATIETGSPVIEISALPLYESLDLYNGFPGKLKDGMWPNRRKQAGINQPFIIDNTASYFSVGQKVQGTGVAAESSIQAVNRYTNRLTLSTNATADGEYELEIGFPIGLEPIVANMVLWHINNTNSSLSGLDSIQSKRIGEVQVSFGDANSQMDKKYGAPSWFVKAIKSSMSKVRAW
jgi:hypothetical protein